MSRWADDTLGESLRFMENPADIESCDGEVYSVRVALLRASDSPRQQGQNREHTYQLLASEADLPPILVHRPSMRVIDGMHRLRVAVLRDQPEIQVRFFDGSAADAFVLAVRANVAHGLPLSLSDRTAAADRILQSHPHWSNRSIAKASGLAPSTVASIRARSTGRIGHSNVRLGQDGRERPLDSSQGRRVAYQLLRENPDISVREVARLSQISVGTVHDVGERLRRGLDPVPDGRRSAAKPAAERAVGAEASAAAKRKRVVTAVPEREQDAQDVLRTLRKDPSLRFTETGRALLRLLDIHTQAMEQREQLICGIPAHCADLVVGLADECAKSWTEFADQLRTRAHAAA
jgi:hypothetical protein